jgi:hypothetical protein
VGISVSAKMKTKEVMPGGIERKGLECVGLKGGHSGSLNCHHRIGLGLWQSHANYRNSNSDSGNRLHGAYKRNRNFGTAIAKGTTSQFSCDLRSTRLGDTYGGTPRLSLTKVRKQAQRVQSEASFTTEGTMMLDNTTILDPILTYLRSQILRD